MRNSCEKLAPICARPGQPPSTVPGLTAQDFTAIREILSKEKDADIRRTAQRALSDLTLVENIENKRKVEALPSNTAIGSGPNRIETREEKIGKTTYLGVRWSNADLASAWLTQYEKSAAWDDKLQRYVVKVP